MPDFEISARVNGEGVRRRVKARQSLADFLRDDLGLTATHLGCEHGVCGACTIIVDGEIVRSCLYLAAQIDGRDVETLEGLSDRGELSELQAAFLARNAAQCGFCTPGMLITARDLLSRSPNPDRAEIRDHLSGNLCRCTGYQAIVEAVLDAAESAGKVPA
ncbi:MAG: (2Fe-2S)-binding protein [Enterovirga sp.]|jgi:carbon-monoxide dehydrogenase small subunit|nr:(2Fe-2S)-binding protein [Enterovirga sp.]